ncbi:hypothetical protein BC829DRAFT_491265 [Chytridium lagenaria]|nr:hypothetical protein BC829DRAFT_491265 [Chytridium lagenaria]
MVSLNMNGLDDWRSNLVMGVGMDDFSCVPTDLDFPWPSMIHNDSPQFIHAQLSSAPPTISTPNLTSQIISASSSTDMMLVQHDGLVCDPTRLLSPSTSVQSPGDPESPLNKALKKQKMSADPDTGLGSKKVDESRVKKRRKTVREDCLDGFSVETSSSDNATLLKKRKIKVPSKINTDVPGSPKSELPTPAPEAFNHSHSPSPVTSISSLPSGICTPSQRIFLDHSVHKPLTPPNFQELTPATEESTWDPSKMVTTGIPADIFNILSTQDHTGVPNLTDEISSQEFYNDPSYSSPPDASFGNFSPTLSMRNFNSITSLTPLPATSEHSFSDQPFPPCQFNPYNPNPDIMGFPSQPPSESETLPYYFDFQSEFGNHAMAAVAAENLNFNTNFCPQVFLPLEDLAPRYNHLRCGAEDITLIDPSALNISVNPITLIATNVPQPQEDQIDPSMLNGSGVLSNSMEARRVGKKKGPGKGVKNGGVEGGKKASGKHRPNFAADVVQQLTEWFLQNMNNPYPNQQVKEMFSIRTGCRLNKLMTGLSMHGGERWEATHNPAPLCNEPSSL